MKKDAAYGGNGTVPRSQGLKLLGRRSDRRYAIATVNKSISGNMIVAREGLPDQYKTLPPDVLFAGILDQLVQQTVLEQLMGDKLSKKDTPQLENDRRGYLSNAALKPVVTGGRQFTQSAAKGL